MFEPSLKNYCEIPIEKLVKADWNYKVDDDKKLETLINNLKRNGQIENIVVRELPTGFYEVVNGNHRYDALIILKATQVVAYNCGAIPLSAAKRIAIETNETRFDHDRTKLAELVEELKSEFDMEDLVQTMPDSVMEFDIEGLGTLDDAVPGDIEEDDFVAEEPKTAYTQEGDLYEFISGGITHRLLCGDSTNEPAIANLMNGQKAHMLHTDPPYNVQYAKLNMSRGSQATDWSEDYCTDWDDDMSDEDYVKFLNKIMAVAKANMIDTAHYYVWHATRYHQEVINSFKVNDIPCYEIPIVWAKNSFAFGRAHYKNQYEPCMYGGKLAINGNGNGARWFGPNNESTVWNYPRDFSGHYIHPTQKPLFLPARAITNSSQKGEIVLELFGGSGSTIMAAEQLGRNCYAMELSGGFCDVIAVRFAKYKKNRGETFQILRNGVDETEHFISLISTIELKEKFVPELMEPNNGEEA